MKRQNRRKATVRIPTTHRRPTHDPDESVGRAYGATSDIYAAALGRLVRSGGTAWRAPSEIHGGDAERSGKTAAQSRP